MMVSPMSRGRAVTERSASREAGLHTRSGGYRVRTSVALGIWVTRDNVAEEVASVV